mgnify:CR=1 FL=1
MSRELTNAAISVLNEAKAVHDKLESLYINAMNFNELNKFAEKFNESLFVN